MLFATSLFIIGLILLVYGADRLVYSAAVLSRSLCVAPWLIGCTIVSFGTSLPELLVSVTAALNHQIDMAVGNMLGFNITKIMLIVGGAALIPRVTFRSDIVRRELPQDSNNTVAVLCLRKQRRINRLSGALLVCGFIAYLAVLLIWLPAPRIIRICCMSQNTLAPAFDFIAAGKEVLAIERAGLAQLDEDINDDFRRACEALFRCAGKVVVMGMGKSGHIGRKLAAIFSSTETPAFFVHPGEASHGDRGMVSPQDIVITLSNSGESHEIMALIPVLKRLHIPLICLTSKPENTMGKTTEIYLCVHVPEEACPLGLAPTASAGHGRRAGARALPLRISPCPISAAHWDAN